MTTRGIGELLYSLMDRRSLFITNHSYTCQAMDWVGVLMTLALMNHINARAIRLVEVPSGM